MIGWQFLPVVPSALIIGFTDNAWAGSIQTSGHIHHNPAQLSKRKICCCWRNNQTSAGEHLSLWTVRIHQKQQSIKDKTEKKTFKPDKKVLYVLSCLTVHWTQSLLYSVWLLHSLHVSEGGVGGGADLFLFIQMNSVSAAAYDKHSIELWNGCCDKQVTAQTLFVSNETEKTNINCRGDFISAAKVWMNSASPRWQLLSHSILSLWREYISLNTDFIEQLIYIVITSTVDAVLIQYVSKKCLYMTFILVLNTIENKINCAQQTSALHPL